MGTGSGRQWRGPAMAISQRAQTLAAQLARASERRSVPPERSGLLFVAADRLGQMAWMLAQAERRLRTEWAEGAPSPGADRLLRGVICQMSMLALECSVAMEEEEPPVAKELEQLARDVSAIATSWRMRAADAACAPREVRARREEGVRDEERTTDLV